MPNPVYPVLAIDPKESKRIPRDGREEDTSGDGSTRVRKLYADKFDFEIKHPFLSPTDSAILEAFYDTNGLADEIDFIWPEDGLTYTVRFGKGALRSQIASMVTLQRHFWSRLVGT